MHTVYTFSSPNKISKYGIGPTQQDKMAKYTGSTQSYQREFSDYSDVVQWYSNIITQSFHYLFGYKTCETGHSELPSLKNSTTNSNAGLSLVFHLPHSPSDHALLVVVDVINHMFSLTEELVETPLTIVIK